MQEAWKRIDDLEQKCAAARAEGASAKGLSERAHRDSQARVDRLQVRPAWCPYVAVAPAQQ